MGTELKEKEKTGSDLALFRPGRLASMVDDMERMMEGLMGRGPRWMPAFKWPPEFEMGYPSVDVFEDADKVTVKAELPGMGKDDVEVNVSDGVITISGEKKKEEKVEKKDYYRLERSYGSFSRTVRLPSEIQSDKAEARFKDGVLEVTLPKTEQAKKKEVKVEIR